ncbi:MAG: type 4a pilus biogenesis protein PilO [Pseudomonadota bacterium]
MSFIDDLNNLDPNDVGRWPLSIRAGAVALVFILVVAAGIWFTVIKDKQLVLEKEQRRETELRGTFENKQRKAANYQDYADQLVEMEEQFGAMLRQLPGETELPNLIIDISQTGLAAGLEERLFEPQEEQKREFYAEKPIRIRLSGDYHSFANFASAVAALPRIVTLHDISITPDGRESSSDQLVLDVTAKTYRYLEEEEG